MKIALATNNKHKLEEIRAILDGCFEQLLSLSELGLDIEIEETGATLEENALIKAREIVRLTGMPALADDTGLMVDALGGAPGVYSARYAGEAHDDKSNRQLLLKNLENAPDRSAHFGTVIAVCYPDGSYLTAEGRVDGKIIFEERGEGGFGYDSLFYSEEIGKTFAEATPEEKNSISHRGRALRAMLEKLKAQA
ncbi:MAG: XTP/dITP diphosphatase [Clostridia bacterium]|jgi:XTP/dITP diphosphohydrolase|nr:XTP/dITP diphosphatase [Clostridia bacterium]